MLSAIGNIRDVKTVKAIAKQAIEDRIVLEELMQFLLNGQLREAYIASWIISHAVEMHPEIMDDKAHELCLSCLRQTNEGGIKRNVIRIWQFTLPTDETIQLEILDCAMNMLSDLQQDLAVRVFSITVIENLLKTFPEIQEEVGFLLEREYAQASPSFKVRADRFFKAVAKLGK
jgi:hypothetical protein